jgi:hypothetical protein
VKPADGQVVITEVKRISTLVATSILLSGCAARQLDPRKSLSGQTTMVGCLNPGSAPGEFVLSERRDGGKTVVRGHPRLALLADNHAVRIVGMLDRELTGQGLKAIKVDQIAGSCSVPF